jgi:DUF4097 and DUF4098 domain-containing protein YvlB
VVSVDSQAQILRDEKRFEVTGTPEVRVTTFDGSIQIQSWNRPLVVVEIEKRGATREAVEALQVTADQDGNKIEVEVKKPRSETLTAFALRRSASAKLIVSVPEHTNVYAHSGDGSIAIEHVSGRVDLHTGDGSIRANEVSGELTMNTGDGSITVNGAEGALDVETGDGSVQAAGTLNIVKLHSGDGSIVFRAQPGTRMGGDWDISTGDGSVTVSLPENFDGDLDVHTSDGTIRNDFKLSAPAGENSRRTLKGRLGDGGRQLKIRTGDGSIRLRAS